MSPELQSVLAYWPTAAFAAVMIAVVFAAGWFGASMKRLKANAAAVGKSRQDLNAARAASREYLAKVKARRAEMDELNKSAAKVFWRNEQTWIG